MWAKDPTSISEIKSIDLSLELINICTALLEFDKRKQGSEDQSDQEPCCGAVEYVSPFSLGMFTSMAVLCSSKSIARQGSVWCYAHISAS